VSIVPEIAKEKVSSFFQVPAENAPAEDGILTVKNAGSN
jgi:hypothetical protein